MATTSSNFVALSSAALVGSSYATNGVALALAPAQARSYATAGLGSIVDSWSSNFATAGYAKNGCVILNLSVSTPITIDLTALTSETVRAGDTTFATWKEISFVNLGANPIAVSPGASNPLTTPLGGTSPTQSIVAGESTRWVRPSGVTVDATHKTLKFDPGATVGKIAICIGGA